WSAPVTTPGRPSSTPRKSAPTFTRLTDASPPTSTRSTPPACGSSFPILNWSTTTSSSTPASMRVRRAMTRSGTTAAQDRCAGMLKAIQLIAIALAGTLLVGTFALIFAESRWVDPNPTSPRDYFLHGSTGTELMPLAVFQVLPTLFPEQFQPAGKSGGDWVNQFGFVRGTPDANYGLPYGLTVSRYRPKSGAPSPIPFVGFNCAVCHAANFERVGQLRGTVVLGMANPRLDLVAFGDAIRRSVLDENRLTMSTI